MTPEKIREVIETYRARFVELDVAKIDYPHDKIVYTSKEVLGHCYGMLDKILGFLEEGRMEKANRWLGFVQGCLFSSGVYPIKHMKDHNRPDDREQPTG